jgi:hypothetical protein
MDRARYRLLEGALEKHHCLPKALGGSNKKDNLVSLTYREHFLAHWLLVKFTEGNDLVKMLHALHMMQRVGPDHTRILSTWQYDICRQAVRSARLGKKMPEVSRLKMIKSLTGRKQTIEQIEKAAAAKRGIPVSAETRAKISVANKGKKATDAQRQSLSRALSGRKLSEEQKRKIGLSVSAARAKKIEGAPPSICRGC